MMSVDDCIFCKIASGAIATEFIYEDEHCVAFRDLDPQAPTHLLVIPRRHFDSLDKVNDQNLIGHLMLTAADIARKKGVAEDGYRVVVNCNSDGGQTVFHLHLHLLAGRQFRFPPG